MTDQEEFDAKYITSIEIVQRLGIARSTLHQANAKGWLPDPITVGDPDRPLVKMWIRADVQNQLDTWESSLERRRAQ